MDFPERLRMLRKEKELSQEKLAEKLGISRQAISKWESGQSYPDINNLVSLSYLYEISLDELLKGNSVVENDKYRNNNKSEENNKCDEEDEYVEEPWEINIILGMGIAGMAIGFITNSTIGSFVSFFGFGIIYIIKGIREGKR